MSAWYRDPLLVKECRTRLRARTATIVVLLQVAILSGMAALLLLSQHGDPAWEVGHSLFGMLLYVQTMAIFFLAPLVAAAVISGEKEQKTYDSLLVTPVSPRRILFAKLASALAVFVVLLAIALPFAVAAYLLGGVAPGQLVLGWLYVLLLMAVAGVMGLYWSTRFERSIAAIPAAAICTVAVGVLLPVLVSDDPFVVAGLSPVTFLKGFVGTATIRFFGMEGPGWRLMFPLLASIGCAIAAASAQRLKPVEDRRYVLMRIFSLLALALVAAGALGELAGQGAAPNDAMTRMLTGQAAYMLLVPLCLLAPWIGASMPVIRSERCYALSPGPVPVRGRMAGVVARVLTGPAGYSVSLALLGCALLYLLRRSVGAAAGPAGGTVAYLYASLVVVPPTYGMLAYRLADRRRPRGRFIGLAAAWVLALVLVFGPVLVYSISRFRDAGGTWPLMSSLYPLTSPLTLATLIQGPRAWPPSLEAARALLGNAGVWALAPALHGILLAVLLLPIYPSWTRRLAARLSVSGD